MRAQMQLWPDVRAIFIAKTEKQLSCATSSCNAHTMGIQKIHGWIWSFPNGE